MTVRLSSSTSLESFLIPPYSINRNKPRASYLTSFQMVEKILSYLDDHRDLLAFEAAAKPHAYLTDAAWARLRKIQHFNFNWAMCREEEHSNKWNYCLTQALIQYVEKRTQAKLDVSVFHFFQETYDQFSGLIKRFPAFGIFILSDLLERVCCTLDERHKEVEKCKKFIYKQAQERWGGELLLQALFEARSYKQTREKRLEDIAAYFTQAMENHVTCASLLAFQVLGRSVPREWYEALIRKSLDHLSESLQEEGNVLRSTLEEILSKYRVKALAVSTVCLSASQEVRALLEKAHSIKQQVEGGNKLTKNCKQLMGNCQNYVVVTETGCAAILKWYMRRKELGEQESMANGELYHLVSAYRNLIQSQLQREEKTKKRYEEVWTLCGAGTEGLAEFLKEVKIIREELKKEKNPLHLSFTLYHFLLKYANKPVKEKVEKSQGQAFACEKLLKEIRELNLSDKGLREVPAALALLTNLRELKLSNNKLDTFPEVLQHLSKLVVLRMEGNHLTQIPSWVEKMAHLRQLYLNQNPLHAIPVALKDKIQTRPAHAQWTD